MNRPVEMSKYWFKDRCSCFVISVNGKTGIDQSSREKRRASFPVIGHTPQTRPYRRPLIGSFPGCGANQNRWSGCRRPPVRRCWSASHIDRWVGWCGTRARRTNHGAALPQAWHESARGAPRPRWDHGAFTRCCWWKKFTRTVATCLVYWFIIDFQSYSEISRNIMYFWFLFEHLRSITYDAAGAKLSNTLLLNPPCLRHHVGAWPSVTLLGSLHARVTVASWGAL